ncbi:MAG: hypothetical protein JW829_12295 [Pirellulales bacterium]|nr:hypothetical protein [Pirellulales bacterium]
MLNKIWCALLILGIGYGFAKAVYRSVTGPSPSRTVLDQEADSGKEEGVPDEKTRADQAKIERNPFLAMGKSLTDTSVQAAESAVAICIGLIGIMALWLGMLNVAKDAGLVDALARALRPAVRWLFPDVPDGHPAQGAMLMNISANMLGLGNAATPLGLKAMRELQTLNPTKETATNAMATFLAINTSSVTLIPMTIIGYRVANQSDNPVEPLAGILMATIVSTTVAILAVRFLARWRIFAMPQGLPQSPPIQTRSSTDRAEKQEP